jgi:cell division transport system permease protein
LTPVKRVSDAGPGWLERQAQDHVRAIRATLHAAARRPFGTLLTALVIGITLALPAGLHTLLANLGGGIGGLPQTVRACLFLKDSVSPERGLALTREIAKRPGVAATSYVSREEALAEFRGYSGFAGALELLKDNPLPASIVVDADARAPQARIEALFRQLAALPEVEQARYDEQWLGRLQAMVGLIQRLVLLTAAALALAVLVVIGNTVRLDIENRRQEIQVLKLIGADARYIRRPFLYSGLWYGLAGACLACLLVEGGWLALRAPALRLARFYESSFTLRGLSLTTVLAVFGTGAALGWLGAFWSVSRDLRRIEPG